MSIDRYKSILNESVPTTIPAPQGSVALNYIDITDPNDPSIVIRGWGSMKMSVARKDVASRLANLADRLSKGLYSFENVHKILTDPRTSGDATAYILTACKEAEEALSTPQGKAKLTLAKRKKRES